MAKKHITRAAVCLHDCVIPHERNKFKPFLFTMGGVSAIVALMLLAQAAYFVQTRVVFKNTDFLATILPSVLATLTNTDRAKIGAPALLEDAHLAQAAQLKAEDMAAKGYFAHVDPEGRQPWYWMDKVGYAYSFAGENLAVNFTDSEDVQKAWMNSPTHHANIVKREYSRIGIGTAKGMYKGQETIFVVQMFATPGVAAAAPVTVPSTSAPEDKAEVVQDTETEVAGTTTEPVPVSTLLAQGAVQGIATEGTLPAASFFAQVAASPTSTIIYILSGLSLLVAVLLLISLAAHARVAYLEVLGGGLLIMLVALSLLVFNAMNERGVEVPDDSQPASAMVLF